MDGLDVLGGDAQAVARQVPVKPPPEHKVRLRVMAKPAVALLALQHLVAIVCNEPVAGSGFHSHRVLKGQANHQAQPRRDVPLGFHKVFYGRKRVVHIANGQTQTKAPTTTCTCHFSAGQLNLNKKNVQWQKSGAKKAQCAAPQNGTPGPARRRRRRDSRLEQTTVSGCANDARPRRWATRASMSAMTGSSLRRGRLDALLADRVMC